MRIRVRLSKVKRSRWAIRKAAIKEIRNVSSVE